MKISQALLCAALLTCSTLANAQDAQLPEEQDIIAAETGAERVVRIEKVIKSDRARLIALKENLMEREASFQNLVQQLAEREARLKAMQTQLGNTTDLDEAVKLQSEIDAYAEKHALVKNMVDLAFQAEKTLREQVQTLEIKIDIDQRALDELSGKAQAPQLTETPASVPALIPPETRTPAQPAALPGMIPGFPTTPSAAPGVAQEILPETAEQIEARKLAEKAQQEAELAEQAVFSFLERKAALQEQMDFENSLLLTAEQSKANFDQVLEIRRQELATAITAGDQAETERAQKNLVIINQALRKVVEEIDEREDTLEAFHLRMQALQEEQLAVTQEAEYKREGAKAAREESIWLNSPLNPVNIVRWALSRGPDMLGVILIALLLLILTRRFVQSIARAMVGKGRRHRRDATTRADTLALSFGSATTMIISIIAVLLVFEAAGINIATILGGAAILGVAIAFGAQNLMRDYFNGFIILIEDQYELNDLVTINDITGRVERVSLRTTALRDLKGKLIFIPNGEIKSVTNRSYEWAQIVFDIRVSYKENVDQVMDELLKIAQDLSAEPEFSDSIIDAPKMLGVDEFAEFGIIIKFIMKTEPNDLFRIKREILRRIKNRFDELGIEIPVAPAAVVLR